MGLRVVVAGPIAGLPPDPSPFPPKYPRGEVECNNDSAYYCVTIAKTYCMNHGVYSDDDSCKITCRCAMSGQCQDGELCTDPDDLQPSRSTE
jgi:hypothetical protein